jgi:VWFA-related protein
MDRQSAFSTDSSQLARCLRGILSLTLAGCILLSSVYQTGAQGTDVTVTVEEAEISSPPTIHLRVSVRDQNGVPIPDLTAEHFEIVEDGKAAYRPAAVDTESNPNAQVSLAIVIDMYRTLGGEPIEAAQQATRDLLTDLLDQPNDPDRAAFVGVRQGLSTDPADIDEAYEVPFTNDRNALLNVINFLHERIEASGPGTPLYDAVIKAIRMADATQPVGHRAVIVMTDGEDRGSVSEDSDTIQQASNARTPIFTVGLSNSGLDEQYLRRLAENTGGTYQTAKTPDDFSSLFSNVLSMLRTQYVLTYESSLPEDGQMHSVLVRVRTPTQLEGFHEYRIEMPVASVEGAEEEAEREVEEETAPTSEPSSLTPTPELEPEPEEEGGITVIGDWIQDNVLLAALAVGAVGLLFLALVIVVIIIRRRQTTAEDRRPLEPPSYPSAPPADFDFEPGGMGPADAFGTDFADFGTRTAPPPVAAEAPAFGTTPSPPSAVPPAPSPPVPQPGLRPSPADRTRIIERAPKMPIVGLLIDRDHPSHRLDIAEPTLVIGRSQESDLVVEHGTVSRQHATIKLEGERFYLYDMGSTNGTFVGEQQIREPIALEDGMTIRFGQKAFIFKVISLET